MTLEEIFNDPEKYHDNVRFKRKNWNNSYQHYVIKKLFICAQEGSLYNLDMVEELAMDDWEVFDDNELKLIFDGEEYETV